MTLLHQYYKYRCQVSILNNHKFNSLLQILKGFCSNFFLIHTEEGVREKYWCDKLQRGVINKCNLHLGSSPPFCLSLLISRGIMPTNF